MKKYIGVLIALCLIFTIATPTHFNVWAETVSTDFFADTDSPEITPLPSGLILVANGSQLNADAFIAQIRKITGDEGYYLAGRILARKDGGAIQGGSSVARALINALINSPVTVTVNFKNDDSDDFQFLERPGDYSTRGVTMNSRTDSELLSCTFVHEMTHAFTDVYALNESVTYTFADENDPDQNAIRKDIGRKYQEAAAITVEQQFRSDMVYPERDTQKFGGIGVNGYAQFPWNYTNEPDQVLDGVGAVYGRVTADVPFFYGPGIVYYLIDYFGY